METKILSAQEAFELSVPIRTRILSIEELMNAITERSLSGFNYLMIIGHISKETEKILTANGYEYSIFRHDVDSNTLDLPSTKIKLLLINHILFNPNTHKECGRCKSRDFIYTLYSTQENRSLIIPIINH